MFRRGSTAAPRLRRLRVASDPVWRFDVRIDYAADGVVIQVRGDLDILTARVLADCLDAVQSRVPTPLALDLHALTFIDGIGIRVIANAHSRALATGRSLSLRHVPSQARRVLELTGVGDGLRIERSA